MDSHIRMDEKKNSFPYLAQMRNNNLDQTQLCMLYSFHSINSKVVTKMFL